LEIIELETCREDERLIRERFYIENNHCLNKQIPFRTKEEMSEIHTKNTIQWCKDNPEKHKQHVRKWRENNQEMIRETNRKYDEAHVKENRERVRKWREDNPEKYKEQGKRSAERQRLKRLAEKCQANV